MTKQEVIDSMIRLATELNRVKSFSEEFAHEPDWEYYLIAELYRTLDQYSLDNNIDICDADRWL
jgi:hypothetical protein